VRRTRIDLEAIAGWDNLATAFHKAARGKRYRADVQAFSADFDVNLRQLANDIVAARLPYGEFRTFKIFDPKPRLIHAACFADRVFHHAVMNLAGGVLEQAMSPSSYACRSGMGVHKAVNQVQRHLRRYSYYCQIDIDGYFAAIDHGRLLQLLGRRFKGADCLAQWQRIVGCYQAAPGLGLPIGSLTSQYFANYYLDGLDRLLTSLTAVRAALRYMDDIVWWCDSRQAAQETLLTVKAWLWRECGLQIKTNVQIQASVTVVFGFCRVRCV